MKRFLTGLVLATGLSLVCGSVQADAIDGNWCHPNGRHLSIDGPNIVTPGGNAMVGEYDRHAFRYTVPTGEKGAGTPILMIQQSEEVMLLWENPSPDPATRSEGQVWGRCDLTS